MALRCLLSEMARIGALRDKNIRIVDPEIRRPVWDVGRGDFQPVPAGREPDRAAQGAFGSSAEARNGIFDNRFMPAFTILLDNFGYWLSAIPLSRGCRLNAAS